MSNVFDAIKEIVGGDGKKEENDDRLADAAAEQLEIENQQIVETFNSTMEELVLELTTKYPSLSFPPLTWADLYTKGSSNFSSRAYHAYNRMQSDLNRNNTSYENYLAALEDREVGEGNPYAGGDFEDAIVEEEKEEIDRVTQEEIDRIAAEQARLTEFRKFHKVLSKQSNDGLYDFILSWEGEGVSQTDGSTIWVAVVKIMRHSTSDPLGKRLLLLTATLELSTWDGFKFSDYKQNYVSELDKFLFEYNQQSSAPVSDETETTTFPVLAFSFNNIWNTLTMIPSLLLSVFNGILFALPFLLLIWGTFYSIIFTTRKIENIGADLIA